MKIVTNVGFWLLLVAVSLLISSVAESCHKGSVMKAKKSAVRQTLFKTWEEIHMEQPVSNWSVQHVHSVLARHNGTLPISDFLVFETVDDGDMLIMYREGEINRFATILKRNGIITYRDRDFRSR